MVKWETKALEELDKIPENLRRMAKMSIEEEVERKGKDIVKAEDVKHAKERFVIENDNITKIAVVRCDIVSETCPGVGCFKAFNKRKVYFEGYENAEIVGFFTCGGCPGRRVYRLVEALKKHGVDVIHLSSCMLMESSYPRCPHIEEIKTIIRRKGIKLVEGTHH